VPSAYHASIVVPLLRQRDAWLRQCVQSALRQTVPCEVIVVTSPRTPASNARLLADLAGRHEGLRVMLQPPGAAFAGAINTGIRRASSGRVGFLLSDDWLDAAVVERCLPSSADIVSTGLKIYAADGATKLGERAMSLRGFESRATLEAKAHYLKHFFLFRNEALLAVGGVDEAVGLTGPDDFDLIWTLLEHGAAVGVAGEPGYNWRDHAGERLTLRDRAAQVRDLEKILDKHGVRGEERRRLIARHSRSYGAPWHVIARRSAGRAAAAPVPRR
jgi:glycosyltransferase involved in cell wall biosynthesis